MAFWSFGLFRASAASRQDGVQVSGASVALGGDTAVPVTVDSSLQLSAVWACVRLISETLGSMPIKVWRVDKNGVKTLATDHHLYKLFNGKVNKWQTRQEFIETMTYQKALLGNSYAAIQRNASGEIVQLIPLMSDQMEVSLDGGDIVYKYRDGSDVKVYSNKTVWHNKLFGNAIVGLNPLQYARVSLGIGLAAEKVTSSVYSNGGKPSGVLTIDKVISKEQRDAIKQNYSDLQEGGQNRLFVLEADMKYQQVSMSPQDIELLSSRRFQIEDIARFFGVPSVLINDTNAGTTWGSGIQQIVQGFYKLGLRPYLERYEASMKTWLLTPEERLEYDIEFDFDALLRPDIIERFKSNKEAIMSGQITPNEARLEMGKAPVEGGDKLYMQKQMTPMDELSSGTS